MKAKLVFCALLFVSELCVAARADTIYLKNGQKITVLKAVESGDHVTGETAVGEISLLKTSVERIEYGDAASDSSARKSAVAAPEIAPPAAAGKVGAAGFNGGFTRRSRWAG